jgi:hypothetical protein
MRVTYKSNLDFQRWLLAHLGVIEFQNRETGAQGAISVWQVSKQFSDELVPEVGPNDLLCNILEMVKRGWLKELRDPILTDDNDSRRFSMTTQGMVQFRKELSPMAQMLVKQEQKLEEKIQNTTANSEVKNRIIQQLNEFGRKFKDRLESEAVEYIVTIMKDTGWKSIPIFMGIIKDSY